MGSSLQQGLNGRVSAASGHGIVAAWVNFTVGVLLVSLMLLATNAISHHSWVDIPHGSWWEAIAGVFGLLYIATVSWVVRLVGVLVVSLLSLIGLISGSIVLDLILPTSGTQVTITSGFGLLLTAIAVTLASGQASLIRRRRQSVSNT